MSSTQTEKEHKAQLMLSIIGAAGLLIYLVLAVNIQLYHQSTSKTETFPLKNIHHPDFCFQTVSR